jgi:hypothetical protein
MAKLAGTVDECGVDGGRGKAEARRRRRSGAMDLEGEKGTAREGEGSVGVRV